MPSTYMKTNLTSVYDREENISSTKSNFSLFYGNKYALKRRSFFYLQKEKSKMPNHHPIVRRFFASCYCLFPIFPDVHEVSSHHCSRYDFFNFLYTMLWTTTSFLSKVHFHNLMIFYVSIFTFWSIPVVHLHLQMP